MNQLEGWEGVTVSPVWSIEQLFNPHPWEVRNVVPLLDKSGGLLGYAEEYVFAEMPRIRRSLPIEFFNHELLEVDINDYAAMARLMSDYGLIGAHAPAMWSDDVGCMLGSSGDPGAILDCMRIDYAFLAVDGSISNEQVNRYLDALRAAVKCAGIEHGRIVSGADVWRVVNTIRSSAIVYKAFMRSTNPANVLELIASQDWYSGEFIKAQGMDAFVEGEVAGVLEDLSGLLVNYSPKAGLMLSTDDKPTFEWTLDNSGSIDEAMALQVWEFGLKGCKEGYLVCRECGLMFVTRRTDAKRIRKPSDRSKAFCCDKCKNRLNQRNYQASKKAKEKRG